MISATAFATAARHGSLPFTPYAPVVGSGSRAGARRRRRHFRWLTRPRISDPARSVAVAGSVR